MTSPQDIAGRYASIPVEMKCLKQWVIWGKNEEKPKCPYSPLSSVEAKANDASTWGAFDEAVSAAARLSGCGRAIGIGFEFGVTPGGIAGIDLDHVLNDAGELAGWASDIVEAMDSYTEYSPSGTGLHILCRITEPMSGFCVAHKKPVDGGGVIEVYDTGRYFTVTGKVYGERKALNERTEALKSICTKYLASPAPESRKEKPLRSAQERNSAGVDVLTNAELWERMFDASNGREIWALYRGNTEAYGGDDSSADMALCNHLAFWTGNDARRMDEMFRESGLYREKWDEMRGTQTYGERTIEAACNVTTESYTPTSAPKEKGNLNPLGPASTQKLIAPSEPPTPAPLPPVDVAEVTQLKPVSEYLDDFLAELKKSREGKAIPTGFDAFDDLLGGGLYPGLYVVGAISSLGKTTFVLQIADSIAKSGHGVMIFSLEMSRSELMAKTVSRESFMRDLAAGIRKTKAQTTRGILRASFMEHLEQAELVYKVLDDYSEWGGNMTIIEGMESVGTSTIEGCVKDYMKMHDGNPPVLVIDYLQMLDPVPGWEKATDKRIIDKNVKSLKILSRNYQMPVICISSFNRENYTLPVSMSSFKESGAIEYSTDVLIGLQYAGVDYQSGEGRDARNNRIAGLIESARMAISQGGAGRIEAKILKNRNGRIGKVMMQFNARFNYFKEAEEQDRDA